MPGDLSGGGSRIENDGFTCLYQFCRGPSDSDFFIPVQSFFGTERIILNGFEAPHGTAVRSHHCSERSKSVEVVADGDGRNGEPSDHIGNRYLAFLIDDVQYTPAPLFR